MGLSAISMTNIECEAGSSSNFVDAGTYVRSYAVDGVVDQFLKSTSGTRRQIISLGAGTDTRPFRLFSQACSKEDLVYHELDFAATTSTKIRYILGVPLLAKGLGLEKPGDATLSEGRDALHSPHYHIHPIDLRTLSPSTSPTFIEGVDPSLPTLLISECCLVYLPSKEADDVLFYFTQTLFPQTTPLSIVLYEPIKPQDAFGQVMASNLAARGIILETLDKYDNIEAERKRLLDFGFNGGQGAADIDFLWERWVSEGEKDRIARIEMLDELEEWKLLSQHYCVAWGWRESNEFESWTTLVSQ
ncbi:Leucine carboxyl methyltransferase 1 [Ascosphaera atra]|nr:Leucine carboxyl methyltransferase 1 [Ascosphaera atra]